MGESANQDALYRRVAELHMTCINQGFLATLGLGFLAQMYRAIDECQSAVLLVTTEGDQIVGFVSAGFGMGPIYRQMLRRWPDVLGALLPTLTSLRRLRRIFEILKYSRDNGQSRDLPQAELLSIAVDSSFRGKGYADILYQQLCTHFKNEGVPSFKIVVGSVLTPAHRFYARMGAQPVAEIDVHHGEKSTVYVQVMQS